MKVMPWKTTIPLTQAKLTFAQGFMSLFSEKYRLPAKKWEFYYPPKETDKPIEMPYVYLWHPWKRKWYSVYCVNRPSMQLLVAEQMHKEMGAELKRLKKEAIEYEYKLINSFASSLNEVVEIYRGSGKYDRTVAGSSYKPGVAPKDDVLRIKASSHTEPHGGSNQQKKQNQQ